MEKNMMVNNTLYIFKKGQAVDVKSAICIGDAPDDQMIYLETIPEVCLGEDEDESVKLHPGIYIAISETFTEEELKSVTIVPNSILYLYGIQIFYHIFKNQQEDGKYLYTIATAIICNTLVYIYPDTKFLIVKDNDTNN